MSDIWTDTAGAIRLEGSLTLGAPVTSMRTTTLSSAELLDLDNTAVELLPAPGGRFYYDVQHIVWHYRYGGIAYAGSFDDFVLGFYPAGVPFPAYNPSNPGSVYAAPNFNNSGYHVFDQTEDLYLFRSAPLPGTDGIAWLASAIEDKPLSAGLQNLSTFPLPLVPWTAGNGTLTVRVFYALINGAPS